MGTSTHGSLIHKTYIFVPEAAPDAVALFTGKALKVSVDFSVLSLDKSFLCKRWEPVLALSKIPDRAPGFLHVSVTDEPETAEKVVIPFFHEELERTENT